MKRSTTFIIAMSLAVGACSNGFLTEYYTANEIEQQFKAKYPRVNLSKFYREYTWTSPHTVKRVLQYETAEGNRSHSPGRTWVSLGSAMEVDDAPCYYYYFIEFDTETRKLWANCGNDGMMLDPSLPPPLGAG